MKIKSFLQFLIEMPLPKDMEPDALVPAAGKYSSIKPSMQIRKHGGEKIGEGSSRVAYQIKVEKSQFKNKQALSKVDVAGEFANTVIKVAMNSKGIAQNEEEVKVFNKFKSNPLLLPIIDTSSKHRINILLSGEKGTKKSVSNWIQMPVAEQWKDENAFSKDFEAYFGNLLGALQKKHPKTYDPKYYGTSTDTLEMKNLVYLEMLSDDYGDPAEEDVSKFINEEQMKNFRYFLQLAKAGLNIYDLKRSDNWGKYKGRPVILDYGFNRKTTDLYNGRKNATATVDDQGNIVLNYEVMSIEW